MQSGLVVNVVCGNLNEDRVIPRFARYLRDNLGWSLTAKPDLSADVIYLSGYFEEGFIRSWPAKPTAAYMTHREVVPPNSLKIQQFDRVAARVDLRIVTAAMYADVVSDYGPTAQIVPPVERDKFRIAPARGGARPRIGLSGFVYANKRKGEDMARAIVAATPKYEWIAAGRGWPVRTHLYPWSQLEQFYQSLDVLVVTARVEGVPMPPLEALACGVSVVMPIGVGLLDELVTPPGIYRYTAGDSMDCLAALNRAVAERGSIDREALRGVTYPYTIGAWCEQHRQAFEEVFACSAESIA